jgi:hypothetical protein
VPPPTNAAQNLYDYYSRPGNRTSFGGGGGGASAGGGNGIVTGPMSGPRPIDEGSVAWERELQKAANERAAAVTAADAARAYSTKQGDTAFYREGVTRNANYDMGQRAADSNQSRMMEALTKLGSFSWMTGAGGSAASEPPVTGGDANWAAANAAAMGRAKDTSAAAVGSAKRSMQSDMASRGISGSGIEAKGDQGIELAGAGQMGAAGRQLAEGTAARAGSVADRNYSGAIQQRGQNMQSRDAASARMSALLPSLASLFRVSASY